MYKKHHNIIDGVYMLRMPSRWIDIPKMDIIDAEDCEGELFNLFKDANVYDIEDIKDFLLPIDEHNIEESIFIIRRDGQYFLCETQGENYIKFSTNISDVFFVEYYDRASKLSKLQEKSSNK